MHPETGAQPWQCRCPRLLPDAPESTRYAYWACLDRGHHDWMFDGSTCCHDTPRNWRQVCHCRAQRWVDAPPSAPQLRRLARLRAEMSTVPILVER